jgi:hypothetical protein
MNMMGIDGGSVAIAIAHSYGNLFRFEWEYGHGRRWINADDYILTLTKHALA